VTIEILAHNRRPIQITKDLNSFWKETYPKIKPELSRRYPKHKWQQATCGEIEDGSWKFGINS
jgi:ATP-dependent helicase HrpB